MCQVGFNTKQDVMFASAAALLEPLSSHIKWKPTMPKLVARLSRFKSTTVFLILQKCQEASKIVDILDRYCRQELCIFSNMCWIFDAFVHWWLDHTSFLPSWKQPPWKQFFFTLRLAQLDKVSSFVPLTSCNNWADQCTQKSQGLLCPSFTFWPSK